MVKEIVSGVQAPDTSGKRNNRPDRTYYENLVWQIGKEENDKRLQEILNSYSPQSLKGHYTRHKGEVLTGLSVTLKKAEFHLPRRSEYTDLFVKKLTDKNIPMKEVTQARRKRKEQRYFLLPVKLQKKAIQILQNDPDLKKFRKNPVRIFCGISDGEIPTTTELIKKGEYASPIELMKSFGLRYSGKFQPTLQELLEGCQIPIFQYGKLYFYSKSQKKELQDFLNRKYGTNQAKTPRKTKAA